MNAPLQLTIDDFVRALGTTRDRVPPAVARLIDQYDFRYDPLTPDQQDQVVLRILRRLDTGELTPVGPHRQAVWEQGWEETLAAATRRDFALESLVPAFIRPEPILRWQRAFIRALDPRFEFWFHDVARRLLFSEFMGDCRAVYEFGSGSAYNLVAFAELKPGLRLVGLDWAEPAVKLAQLVGETHGLNLTGRRFNLFEPDASLPIGSADAAVTICALEQVGDRFAPFLEFLLAKRPRICVHMEPLLDLYDPDSLPDYLAIRFHTARRYLNGFLARLRALAAANTIELVRIQRMNFGSLYHEGYSFVVWRPR